MTDHSERGRFIWHELRTPNPAGACDFYTKVVGWKTESSDPDSSTFTGPMGPLGGCSRQSPTAVPRWIPFVTVGEVEQALSSAQALGAGVVVEPTALESGGRYAVLTDPQGAAIGIYSAEDFGPDRAPEPLEFSWHELTTTDFRSAFGFYGELFGWESVSEFDMGPMGVYLIFGRGDKQLGGMFNKPDGRAGEPAWLSYIRVADLAGTIEKLKAAHGSLLVEPMEVPGGDWIAQVLDPHGAAFALHIFAADVKARPEEAGADRAAAAEADVEPSPPNDGVVTDVWSAEPPPPTPAKKPAKKKAAQKKAAGDDEASGEAAAKSSSTKKAAKAQGTAQTASKAGTKKTAKKKSSKKKTAKKKAAAKKAGKKTAKKAAKRAGKKATKKAAKASRKKAAKKAGKKSTKKAAGKARKKSAKKTSGGKKAGRSAKKTGKKAAKKKGAKRTGAKKKPGRKSGSRAAKKPGKKTSASARKAGKKKAKKTRRKSR